MTSITTTLPAMMADLGKLLRHNFKMLAEAGCKHIQIDEPLFTMADDDEVARRRRGHQSGDRGPARRCPRLGPYLPGQLRGREGIRRPDRPPLFRRRPLQGRSGLQDRVLRPIWSSTTWRTITRACWATGSSASARSTCRIPRSRAARPWPNASGIGWLAPEQTIITSLLRLQSSAAAASPSASSRP